MPRKPSKWSKMRRYDPLTVLVYTATYKTHNRGRSPSQRQIQHALGISAPSVVHMILLRLERRGLLTITRYGQGRTSDLFLTDAGTTAMQQWQREHGAAGNSTGVENR